MKQFLLLIILFISSVTYSQEYTENLIDYTDWINAGTIGQPITCWAPGEPGYCGPLPAAGAFGNPSLINFSYGLSDIYQMIDIGNALKAAGNGIIVNGFNFSFTAKNGNGWDDGRVDYLQAYANFYNNGNTLLESYNYDLNYKFGWTGFNFSETFADPYQINTLGDVQVGFVGRDNNGWAGFYGPEVTNINFNLKYGIDPCYDDPLSSTSCSGFQEALLELQCSGDPLASVNCPGYLEASLQDKNIGEADILSDNIMEVDKDELEELFVASIENDFIEEIEDAEEIEEENEVVESNEPLSPELLKLALSIADNTNDRPVGTINSGQLLEQTNITNTNESENNVKVTELSLISDQNIFDVDKDTQTKNVQLSESNESDELITESTTDMVDTILLNNTNDQLLSSEDNIQVYTTVAEDKPSAEDTSSNVILDNEILVAVNDIQSTTESSEITEVIESNNSDNEKDIEIEEITDTVTLSQPTLEVATTNSTNIVFSNNTMQQVLAFGGNITEILNTPVPDFSRFEIKPPSQDEQVQTAKVENTIETMSEEEIELQAQQRIGSMDAEAQAIALQLMGYKAGFDQYGGMLSDQNNWYQSVSVYTNKRLPSGSNLLFGAQDQRHQELMSLQYRR